MLATPSNVPEGTRDFARRDFLRLLGGLPLWLAGGAALVGLEKYLSFEADPPPQTLFVLAQPGDYPIGSITPAPEAKAVLYHDTRGFFALSIVCTHLGCTIKKTASGYDCPCHGSRFDPRGSVLNGPAASPLSAVAVAQDSQGRLMLDVGQGVPRDRRFVPS